jgi:acetyl-CoA carboxylase biotin carboxyl carrier protein
MDLDAIRRLIDTLIEKQVEEFDLQEGDLRIRIKRAVSASPASAPVASAAGVGEQRAPAPQPPAATPPEEEGVFVVRSPIVGTFFASPSPGAKEFVRVGDTVEAGQVLCIIEAMKLMNEIEAEVGGVITRRFVTNGQPVEYGEALFAIRPTPA